MANQKLRNKCGECGNMNLFIAIEMPLRTIMKNGKKILLCQQCCKKVKWFTKGVCNLCSEHDVCKNSFEKQMKKKILDWKGI